jgi:DNA invertase Pin-like site-specific DNA recombinase
VAQRKPVAGRAKSAVVSQPFNQSTAMKSHRRNSVLNEDNVRHLRQLRQDGVSAQAIAQQFGISRNQVIRIVSRQQWAEVE